MKHTILLVLYLINIYYNLTNAQSSFTVSPLLARSHISATVVANVAFFAGGELSDGRPSNRIDVYNRQTEQWSVEYLPSSLILSGSAPLFNKAVFVSNDTDVYFYDTLSHTWTTDTLNKIDGISVGSSSRAVYLAGGAMNRKVIGRNNTTWSQYPNMLSRKRSRIAIASALNTVVFAGGEDNQEITNYVEIFNEVSGSRSSMTLLPSRCDIRATSLNNRLILLSGGISNTGDALANIEIYDVIGSAWSQKMMSIPRKNHAAASTSNGLVVFAGGEGTTASITADIYNPATNQITVIILGQARMKFAAVSIGTSIMLAGGIEYPSSTKISSVEFLDFCFNSADCQSRSSFQFSGSCNTTTNLCDYSAVPSISSTSSTESSSSSSSEEPSTTSSSTFVETSSEFSSSSSDTAPPSSTGGDIPVKIECPSSAPYLCNEMCTGNVSECFPQDCHVFCPDINQCVNSTADCPSFTSTKCPFMCPDGTCGNIIEDCYCKNIPGKLLRCFNGSCQSDCKNASAPYTAPILPVQLYLPTDVTHDITIYGATEGHSALAQVSFPSNVASSNNVATEIKGVALDIVHATSFPDDVMGYIASPVIDIKMYSGDDSRSPITSLQNPTKISFQLSVVNEGISHSKCLAFINTTTFKWQCVDRNLTQESNGSVVYSGYTNHFTSFAVLVEYSSTSNSKDENKASPNHEDEGVPASVVIGAVIGAVAAMLVGIVGVIIIRKRTRAQELKALNRVIYDRASVNSTDL